MSTLFYAHSGLRYLVLLAGTLLLAWSLYGGLRGGTPDRGARILGAVFVGLLDLQVLLGLLLLWQIPFYAALSGHIVMMLAAAIIAHVLSLLNRRRPRPSWGLALAMALVPLLLVVGGIMAIGRPVLGSTTL